MSVEEEQRLPGFAEATVPGAKILDFLLNPDHPIGRHRARWLAGFGFRREAWWALRDALLDHARRARVVRREETEFGLKCTAIGPLPSPDGRDPLAETTWQMEIESGQAQPRLVTLVPHERGGRRRGRRRKGGGA